MSVSLPLSAPVVCLFLFRTVVVQAQGRFGGGPAPASKGDCIAPVERRRVEQNIAAYHALHGYQERLAPPALYVFHPQAGNLWGDLFVNNFADLDPGGGIRDWDCSDFTYNGHRGHDVDLRSFDEQEIGTPVFAALDGVAVDTHDGEFDRNTSWNGQPANDVVLYHGGTHYSYYWHLKKGSVAVSVGQPVKAGEQIGLTASSGSAHIRTSISSRATKERGTNPTLARVAPATATG